MDLYKIINEHLDSEDYSNFGHLKVKKHVNKALDHYFGEGNDSKREEIDSDLDFEKSDTHKSIENYLGHDISINDYINGRLPDGRKIGKLLVNKNDNTLRDSFAADTTREGNKTKQGLYMTFHRGVEVAGQTHPIHSWSDISCKNVKDGQMKHYLPDEVKEGGVVAFGRDSSGKEIYRATMLPYRSPEGNYKYMVDSDEGVRNPAFTTKVKQKINELVPPSDDYVYHKPENVYNQNNQRSIINPDSKELKSKLSASSVSDFSELYPLSDKIDLPLKNIHKIYDDAQANNIHPEVLKAIEKNQNMSHENSKEFLSMNGSGDSLHGQILSSLSKNKNLQQSTKDLLVSHFIKNSLHDDGYFNSQIASNTTLSQKNYADLISHISPKTTHQEKMIPSSLDEDNLHDWATKSMDSNRFRALGKALHMSSTDTFDNSYEFEKHTLEDVFNHPKADNHIKSTVLLNKNTPRYLIDNSIHSDNESLSRDAKLLSRHTSEEDINNIFENKEKLSKPFLHKLLNHPNLHRDKVLDYINNTDNILGALKALENNNLEYDDLININANHDLGSVRGKAKSVYEHRTGKEL